MSSVNMIPLLAALIPLGGLAADLLMAIKYYHLEHDIKGWDAIRLWTKKRAVVLGGVAALYLTFECVFVYTDLIKLPGLLDESNRNFISANRYLKQRKYREAALELRNALVKNPEDHEIRLTLARTLHVMGMFREAEAEYRTVIANATASVDARLGLARVLLVSSRKDEALTELRAAIRLQPNAAEPHLLLSRILRTDGDYPHATEESRLALTADPDHLEARKNYITTALEGRLYAEALREAEVGRMKSPEDMMLLGYQARALQGLGRTGEADALLRKAAAGDRRAATPWLVMGDLLLLRKETRAALNCYEEGLKRDPNNIKTMNNIAALTAESGADLKRARELAAYLTWKHPDNTTYADTLGWVLVKQGEAAQAVPYLRQAVVGAPQSPGHHYHLGTALLKIGSRKQGRQELEAALHLASDFDGASRARTLLGE